MNVLASFISSGSAGLLKDVFLLFFIVFWLALGYWTYRDASGGSRIRS